MKTSILARRFVVAAAIGLSAVCGGAWGAEPKPPIRIGMLATMFRGRKPELFAAFKVPFTSLVKLQTGFESKIELASDPDHLLKQLSDGKLQFGLCHGFEFAWMKEKDPGLRALMIAAPSHRPLKGFVVVAANSSAKSLCDLTDKVLALPAGLHETAKLFVERRCLCDGKPPSEYLREITNPVNTETALHEVFDDKVQAAVVDGLGWRCYEERYPARFKRLRILNESQVFPMSVVAVREGAVDSAILRRFEAGMSKAHATAMGRQFLGLTHSAGFETVPADYDRQIAESLKLYPAPK